MTEWIIITYIAMSALVLMLVMAAGMQAKDEAPRQRIWPAMFLGSMGVIHAVLAIGAVLGVFGG